MLRKPLQGVTAHYTGANVSMSCAYVAYAQTLANLPHVVMPQVHTRETLGHVYGVDYTDSLDLENQIAKMIGNRDFFAIKDRDMKGGLILSWINEDTEKRVLG